MSATVAITVAERTENHEIRIRVGVEGAAPIVAEIPEGVLFTPHRVDLVYRSDDGDKWFVSLGVYGYHPGQPSRGFTWFGHDSREPALNTDDWPTWLVDLAEQHHPARPGGWPGDDPEGSYL